MNRKTLYIALIAISMMFSACKASEIAEPVENFMAVGKVNISIPAAKLYFYAFEKKELDNYKKISSGLWEKVIGDNGLTYGTYQKEVVFYENIINLLALASMYEDEKVLSVAENEMLEKAAEAFLTEISSTDIELLELEQGDVYQLFKLQYEAGLMEQSYIKEWQDVISEEEYRVCLVQKNEFLTASDADEFYSKYMDSFLTEGTGITWNEYSIMNVDKESDLDERQLSAIMSLKNGEITHPFSEDDIFVIYEMMNIYDEDLSSARKKEIIASQMKKTWQTACKKYLETAMTHYNAESWSELKFSGEDAYSASLMKIFDQFTLLTPPSEGETIIE